MIRVEVKDGATYSVEKINKGEISINGKARDLDIIKINDHQYHLILNRKSLFVDIVQTNPEEKSYKLLLNGKTFKVKLKDELDLTLEKMGLNHSAVKVEKEVKAPMPGSILEVMVKPEMEVKKGDPLLILEAMKMENVIKSPMDGVVSKVEASQGENVEKNHILVHFK